MTLDLFFPKQSKSETDPADPDQEDSKGHFAAAADKESRAKTDHRQTQCLILSAHNNTPCTFYAGGDLF